MSVSALRAASPPVAATDPSFSIQQSPFAATSAQQEADVDDVLAKAIAVATRPVGAKRPHSATDGEDDAAADPQSPPPRQGGGGKHRPPRPPSVAEHSSLVLDLAALQQQQAAPASGSPRQAGRSPRSPAGGRRPARQSSRTQGRVCIECGVTSTTQWRSQGLLCNSCGVKLIKGRLPMDEESMHRRFLRLPPTIREHPMWEAAQMVAAAQSSAAAAAAAGRPWSCPGCGHEGGDKVSGPFGLHHCLACAGRYHAPAGGAAAVAATVAAPPGAPTPSPSHSPGATTPGSGHKRRKQAAPRSAHGGPSPLSASSSGSSSIQAYSFQSAREDGQDDATSNEPSPGRTPSRRLQQLRQQARGAGAAAGLETPGRAAALPAQAARCQLDTPTAAEAAAALLVLTESDELRVAAAMQLDAAVMAAATAAAAPVPVLAQALPVTSAEKDTPPTAAKEAGAVQGAAPTQQPEGQHCGGSGAVISDSMQLYQLCIAASRTPEAEAAGLTAGLIGRFLAAHTMPAQAMEAGAGSAAAAAPDAPAVSAFQARQEQQARLVALMVQERQYGAAVGLMQGVVKLAGLQS